MAVRLRAPVVDPAGWATARRVLCVRTDGIGDVVMTAPALRALRAAGPRDRTLTVLASPHGAEAARLLPDVDETITCRAPWSGVVRDAPDDDLHVLDELRARRFDAAAIFTVSTQSALPAATWCRLAGIPRRLGHSRENPYGLLTDWVPERDVDHPIRHEVVRQLDLVAHVGAPSAGPVRLAPPAADRSRAAAVLAGRGVDASGPWIALHPGASAPSRRYPPASFATAADLLVRAGWSVVLTGGPADEAVVRAVRRAMAAPSARAPRGTSLRELAALLSLATVVVTNNTGPAHLAALIGTPVVDLYALTNLQHRPWGSPSRVLSHDVPCRGCLRSICPEGHQRCLRGVAPGAVVDAVHHLVGRPSRAEALVG